MSRKYKMNNPEGTYFVSFATVYWIDVFIREIYFQALIPSLAFCRKEKGMILYGYCIMPSHIHLLFQAKEKDLTFKNINLYNFICKRSRVNDRL